jgi:hypothetical protein
VTGEMFSECILVAMRTSWVQREPEHPLTLSASLIVPEAPHMHPDSHQFL